MLGSLLAESGDTEQAIRLLSQAENSNQEDSSPCLVLGHIYRALGRHEDALTSLEKAVQRDPDDAETLCTYGGLLIENGRHMEALPLFEKAIEFEPDNAHVWSTLASLWMRTGRYAAAADAWKQARSHGDKDPESVVQLARCLCEIDCPYEAANLLNDHLSSYSKPHVLRDHLVSVSLQQGDFAQALVHNQIARELAPDDPRYVVRHAEILYRSADLRGAFNLLKPLLESASPPVEAVIAFSSMCYFFGMKAESRLLLQQAAGTELSPLHRQQVETALRWLETL
jgi:Flp pilus assembly protein TadD